MTTDAAQLAASAWPSTPPGVEVVSVGEGSSTDFIPRVWAERMLASIRDNRPNVWSAELAKASQGGKR
jgi:hypothetical protein